MACSKLHGGQVGRGMAGCMVGGREGEVGEQRHAAVCMEGVG